MYRSGSFRKMLARVTGGLGSPAPPPVALLDFSKAGNSMYIAALGFFP